MPFEYQSQSGMAAPHEELRRNHVKALESISQLTKENVRALQRVEALTKENEALKTPDGRLVPAGLQSLLELKDAAEAGELATLRREADEARAALKSAADARDAEVREVKAARDRQQRLAEEARATLRRQAEKAEKELADVRNAYTQTAGRRQKFRRRGVEWVLRRECSGDSAAMAARGGRAGPDLPAGCR